MLRATRRRIEAPAWLALALVVGLPAMAEAQLFPNRTIRRQRESCATEPPYYSQVRREYYGYFPTCWSKFPEGWGCPCPNPELPNAKAAFEKRPRDEIKQPTDLDGDEGMDPNPDRGMPNDRPATDPNVPNLPPGGRSPFDLEGGANPNPTIPPAGRPMSNPTRPGDNPSVPPPTGPTTLREMPSISAPTIAAEPTVVPGSMMMAADATLASNNGNTRPDLGPLPSAPTPSPYSPTDVNNGFGPSIPQAAMAASVGSTTSPSTATTPAKAPKRRSLLGGLFGSGNKQVR